MRFLCRWCLPFLIFAGVSFNAYMFLFFHSREAIKSTDSSSQVVQNEHIVFTVSNVTYKSAMDISSLLQKYELKSTSCESVSKSEARNSIIMYKTYQYFSLSVSKHKDPFHSYLMNFYFDDRFYHKEVWYNHEHDELVTKKGRGFKYYVRTVASILGPDSSNRSKLVEFHYGLYRRALYGYFWYDGYNKAIIMPCGCQDSADLHWKINGSNYYQYVFSCPVPEIDQLPIEFSISSEKCAVPTTFKRIIYPEVAVGDEHSAHSSGFKSEQEYMEDYKRKTKLIGLCIQPLFGTLGDADVTYVASWMEFLKIFGISEVTIANSSLILQGDMIKNTFKYYENSGYLTLQQFPVIPPYVNDNIDEQAGSLAVKQMALADCFLRKIKKYWYVLIHDFDEILVPNYNDTYQDYLSTYLFKTNASAQKADCLASRSAYFYRNITQLHTNKQPDWVPLLKYLTRFEIEPFGVPNQGGVAMVKSFSKMSTLVAAGCHLCRQTHDKSKRLHQLFLPPDGLLIHHFRKSCHSVHGDDIRCLGKTDKDGRNDTLIYDERIIRFASKVVPNVRIALEKIGYFERD